MDTRVKAGAAIAFLGLVGALVYGLWPEDTIHPSSDGLSVSIDWPDGGAPYGATCVWTMGVQVSETTLAAMRLKSDAGAQCGVAMICAPPSDEPEPQLPGEVIALTDTQHEDPYVPGMPHFWAALQGHPSLPCACSTGADCEALRPQLDGTEAWGPAPTGLTLDPGKWRGTDGGIGGCFPKVCVEPQAGACWPPECPQ